MAVQRNGHAGNEATAMPTAWWWSPGASDYFSILTQEHSPSWWVVWSQIPADYKGNWQLVRDLKTNFHIFLTVVCFSHSPRGLCEPRGSHPNTLTSSTPSPSSPTSPVSLISPISESLLTESLSSDDSNHHKPCNKWNCQKMRLYLTHGIDTVWWQLSLQVEITKIHSELFSHRPACVQTSRRHRQHSQAQLKILVLIT